MKTKTCLLALRMDAVSTGKHEIAVEILRAGGVNNHNAQEPPTPEPNP